MPPKDREVLAGKSILVISHDFPPIRSPQALRALRFCEALTSAGAKVTVLTRTLPAGAGYSTESASAIESLRIERCSPGPFESLVDAIANRRHPPAAPGIAPSAKAPVYPGPSRLNWKGRLIRELRRLMDQVYFPDGRSAWCAPARAALRRKLAEGERFDLALLMHEPAASARLWPDLETARIPWAVDLADPVLAPYTPWHWRARAKRLERELVSRAIACSVTNPGTAQQLSSRHAVPLERFDILPQGFTALESAKPPRDSGPLHLFYCGRFYPFRPATPLIEAVLDVDGVVLEVAGPELPECLHRAAALHPERIRILGELVHEDALRCQARADVLVSVGNRGTEQTPGKAIEYFGACRPILHLWQETPDAISRLIEARRRGVSCAANRDAAARALKKLANSKREGRLDADFDLGLEAVEDHAWASIGQRLAAMLARTAPASKT